MATVDQRRSALPVPYAIDVPDRVRKERYFDADFYQLEVEMLWPRVWQMACRLEEIPQPRDFVEYEFLDQSVVVLRTDDMQIEAIHVESHLALWELSALQVDFDPYLRELQSLLDDAWTQPIRDVGVCCRTRLLRGDPSKEIMTTTTCRILWMPVAAAFDVVAATEPDGPAATVAATVATTTAPANQIRFTRVFLSIFTLTRFDTAAARISVNLTRAA